jgi:hypothetical protein
MRSLSPTSLKNSLPESFPLAPSVPTRVTSTHSSDACVQKHLPRLCRRSGSLWLLALALSAQKKPGLPGDASPLPYVASAGGAAYLFGEFHHLGRIDVAGVGGAHKRLVREREANRRKVAHAPG